MLKAVILAAGQKNVSDGSGPITMERLGDRRIIDYVIQNALHLVSCEDLYIVVGNLDDEVASHLRQGEVTRHCHLVVQSTPQGTGHAVLQLAPELENFDGNLLILYGDTPLFRPASIRGLLTRHILKEANLTLLAAVVEGHDLPYGRIVRDAGGHIIDIIEDVDASPEMREIRELNAGAYLVRTRSLFPVLRSVASAAGAGEVRLTDCAYRMIRSGMRVESYRIYDPSEVLGINSQEDLDQAAFILQKRLYRPRRHEEETRVAFGTGGWRAVIGEGFTMHNVRRLCQALANEITRRGFEKRGVVIGYDRRFLSDRSAETAAEVFAGNNIQTILLSEAAPTPLVTYATAQQNAAYGLAFTASHNAPEWNGLKVFRSDGSLPLDDETHQIESECNHLTARDVVQLELDLALDAGIVQRRDFTNAYVDAVESLIDMQVIREAGLKVIVDPMYGVGQVTMGIVLTEARCRVTFINERHNPLFGGRSPAPDLEALRMLMTHVRNEDYDLGLATDGDADRIAIVDEMGEYIPVNDILLLQYWYLHEVRGERGGVVRNLATTHLLDRLAAHVGETCYEVPVGFKHISSTMLQHDALLGGESSGGLTIRGHIQGKDGIFAAALIVEMLARTGERVSQLRERVYKITGRLYGVEANIAATPEMRVIVPRRVQALSHEQPQAGLQLGPYPVLRVSNMDGIKFLLENDNWALLRFSGTEPVLRLFTEADTPEKAQALIDALKALASL